MIEAIATNAPPRIEVDLQLAEDRCAENDAEQDSGVVVDTDLGCRGEAVSVGDEYLAQGAEEADQHEQHKLARVRHNEIADVDERQGTEHAECGKVHDDGNSIDFSFKIP